jgi:integrase
MRKRLTELGVARLNPPEQGYDWYPDSLLPSFGLRVYATGNRVFGITRRWHGAKHPTFRPHGKWPELSLAAARKKAREILSDPDARRRKRDTVAAVAAEWLKRDQAGNRSVDEVARIFAKDVLPVLGDRSIAEVRKRDIIALIDGVADRGAGVMANRTLASVKRFFAWAANRDIIESDPAAHVEKVLKETPRDRVLSASELASIWDGCEGDFPFGSGIRLLILTLARRSEVFHLQAGEIDRETAVIRLPRERTKTGEARAIPLSEPALAIVDALPDLGGPFVLSIDGQRPYHAFTGAKLRLDARIAELRGAPLPAWRIHDIRRSTATGMQRLGGRARSDRAVPGPRLRLPRRHRRRLPKAQVCRANRIHASWIRGARRRSTSVVRDPRSRPVP